MNSCFLPILLNGKREKDGYSLTLKRVVKIGIISSEDAFLNIAPDWPSFCFSRTGISDCRENYVEKGTGDNLNLNTSITDIGADDSGTSTTDSNKRVDNPDLIAQAK